METLLTLGILLAVMMGIAWRMSRRQKRRQTEWLHLRAEEQRKTLTYLSNFNEVLTQRKIGENDSHGI